MKAEARGVQNLGEYIRIRRTAQGMSIRELARRSGLDDSGLVRLERGDTKPQPGTLEALAPVLKVPLAELFTCAGYTTPDDLPSVDTYLRTCYSHLPEEAIASATEYIEQLATEYAIDPSGPTEHEDEANPPQSRR